MLLVASFIAANLLVRANDAPEMGIAPVDVKVSSSQASDPRSLIDGRGLAESRPGSGLAVHTDNKYADGGTMWNADYSDAHPWLVFDLGKATRLTGMHIWNGNEKGYNGRGVQGLEVLGSADGEHFQAIGSFRLKEASGQDDDPGEEIAFPAPVSARFVRFNIQSNYKPGDPPSLSEVRFLSPDAPAHAARVFKPKYQPTVYPVLPVGAPALGVENIAFPADAGVIDITKPPYNAKGDGIADDTAAIQRALSDHPNAGAIVYLPNGQYLISDTLKWAHGSRDGWEEKNTALQGQSASGAVIRLKSGCAGFDLPRKPKGMIWTGAAPAQRFSNEVYDLTLDTGCGNPGAVGMQFMANNQGCVERVRVISGDGQGVAGIDLRYTNENGPLLIDHVSVTGFDYGIWTANSINSQILEAVDLTDQNVAGLRSDGQTLAIRRLSSHNAVPAVLNNGGHLALLESSFIGKGEAVSTAAIVNSGELYARDVKTEGYASAIEGRPGALPTEYTSRPIAGGKASLGLPVKEIPYVPWGNPKEWVAPRKSVERGGGSGDTAAIQEAIDSGAETVYFPRGTYKISSTILVHGKVRRLIGCRANLDVAAMEQPVFKVVDGDAPVVVFERLSSGYTKTPTFENASGRTVVISHCLNVCGAFSGRGDLFLNDVCSNPFTNWRFAGQSVWARQLNVENQGEHVSNDGGKLWILGLKTERTGPLVTTRNGGETELLGGLSYTTTDGRIGPMFNIENAKAFLFFREVCFNGTPYREIVHEVQRDKETRMMAEDAAYKGGSLIFRSAE